MMIGTVVAVTYSVIDRSMKGSFNRKWRDCGARLAREAMTQHDFAALMRGGKEKDREYVSELTLRVRDTVGPCTPEVGAVKPTNKQLAAFAKGFEGVVGKDY